MTQSHLFAPYADLAAQLLPHAFDKTDDGSHDVSHIARVWANARAIHAEEGGDGRCLAADKAAGVLMELGWGAAEVEQVSHAIVAHSFSANVTPETIEAKTLQDADRLDAIGLVGVARCFYVAGRMGSGLYDAADPRAEDRDLDDRAFAIDHFETKLLKLASGFQTATGAAMAQARHAELQRFLDGFLAEIGSTTR